MHSWARKGKAVFKAGTWLQVRACTPKKKPSKGQVAGSRSVQRLFSMHFAEAESITRERKEIRCEEHPSER